MISKNSMGAMKGKRLDSTGIRETPGMPHWSAQSNAKRGRPAAQPTPTAPPPTAQTVEAGKDYRYTVKELPAGYQSALNPADCRPWAATLRP